MTSLKVAVYLIVQAMVVLGPFFLNIYLISKKGKPWGINSLIVFCATAYPIGKKRRQEIFRSFKVSFDNSDIFVIYQMMYLTEVLLFFLYFKYCG